ncbi:hypothetical protein GGI07_000912 [Coemansia sp. Benny D115]|nr:hypothetical protein GGI07_000912 [Coemansia sp. Benny D115]
MSLAILGFFFSYLLWDLILGLWYYKSMITWLTGYIHHVFYIGLCILFAWKFYWYMPERAFVWRISVLVLPMHLCWFCGALGQLGKPKKNTEK